MRASFIAGMKQMNGAAPSARAKKIGPAQLDAEKRRARHGMLRRVTSPGDEKPTGSRIAYEAEKDDADDFRIIQNTEDVKYATIYNFDDKQSTSPIVPPSDGRTMWNAEDAKVCNVFQPTNPNIISAVSHGGAVVVSCSSGCYRHRHFLSSSIQISRLAFLSYPLQAWDLRKMTKIALLNNMQQPAAVAAWDASVALKNIALSEPSFRSPSSALSGWPFTSTGYAWPSVQAAVPDSASPSTVTIVFNNGWMCAGDISSGHINTVHRPLATDPRTGEEAAGVRLKCRVAPGSVTHIPGLKEEDSILCYSMAQEVYPDFATQQAAMGLDPQGRRTHFRGSAGERADWQDVAQIKTEYLISYVDCFKGRESERVGQKNMDTFVTAMRVHPRMNDHFICGDSAGSLFIMG
jgi:hypothetical protein